MTTAVPTGRPTRGKPKGTEPFTFAGLARKTRDGWKLTMRTLAMVWRSSPAATALLGVLTLAVSVLPILIAYAGKGIVDAVVAQSREHTIRWVLIELGAVATQALVQRSLALTRQLLGARLALDINVKILEKAQELELRHFEDGR